MGTIEEAIKQSKFNNEHEKVVVNILYTASWLDSYNIQRFKPFGISPQQFNVLRILRGSFPNALRLSDINERIIDKTSIIHGYIINTTASSDIKIFVIGDTSTR